MTETIEGRELTGIEVDPRGTFVRIGIRAADGARHALELTNDCVGSLLMTLPRLMQMLTRQRLRDPSLRYVFPLGTWNVEEATTATMRILTLSTPDGFEASFALSQQDAQRLAAHLAQDSLAESTAPLVN